MSRYIDADALGWIGYGTSAEFERGVNFMLDKIAEQPTADVKEVIRGKWIKDEFGGHHCSACNARPLLHGDESDALSNFCPECGADMRGENNDG